VSIAAARPWIFAACALIACSTPQPHGQKPANVRASQPAEPEPDARVADADSGISARDAGASSPPAAQAPNSCSVDGAMACAGVDSRVRFVCENGLWVSASMCAADERCTMPQADCQAVAEAECVGRAANVAFCNGTSRLICDDLGKSSVEACGANQQCRALNGVAGCSCAPGTVDSGSGCSTPDDCKIQQGGCDPLTACSTTGSQRTCSACPAGFSGDGLTGCKPLLQSVTLSCGQLTPALSPNVTDYRIQVSVSCQQLTARITAPTDAQVEVNGTAVVAGTDWTSDTLMLGDNTVHVAVTSAFGIRSEYNWLVTRSGSEEAYIKASNPAAADGFGASVALSGDALLVGAPWQDGAQGGVAATPSSVGATDSGAAYLFTRAGRTWSQQLYLKADAPSANDYFGTDLALLDDTIVIGAPRTDPTGVNGAPPRVGAAYVFARAANGTWSQQARLDPQDGAAGDLFGLRLVLSKELLVISAPAEKSGGQSTGAVYLFSRTGSGWQQTTKLTAARPINDSAFGSALALDGDTLVIGAQKDGSSESAGGSAYVFTRQNGVWTERQRLEPAKPSAGATFGWSVALQGNTLVVGAPRATLSLTSPSGEAYVFERKAGQWSQTTILAAPVPRVTDYFGVDLVLTASGLLVGASGDASSSTGLTGNMQNNGAPQSGALYLYARRNDQFSMTTYIKASNTERNDAFGIVIGWSGDTIVAGANYESRRASGINPMLSGVALMNSGAAYVIR
jgi:hypothetical protein